MKREKMNDKTSRNGEENERKQEEEKERKKTREKGIILLVKRVEDPLGRLLD
jgi:hypothetical protein